ncbi:MAG: efflux RND transporter permease subunit, partial [Chloroflexi bacterium]|nr:efflux RND transporter permease subunit [Chloroflexota bacterium]
MSYLTQISLRWRMATVVAMFMVIAGGIWTLTRLQVELFPDVDFPLIVLSTVYPGADAETVLQDVTIPLEDAAAGIGGLETVQSVSSPGFSLV